MADKLTGMRRVFRKSAEAMGDWLREEPDEPAPGKPKKARKKPAPGSAEALRFGDIDEALAQLGKLGIEATGGRVQVVDFNALRDELGEAWERQGARIEQMIGGAIRHYLPHGDLHWQVGDHAHLLVFASLTPEQAAHRCGQIRDKVEEFLKGHPGLAGKVRIETATAAIPASAGRPGASNSGEIFEQLGLTGGGPTGDTKTDGADAGDAAASPDWRFIDSELLLGGDGLADTDAEKDRTGANWRLMADDIEAAEEKLREVTFARRCLWDTTRRRVQARAWMPLAADQPADDLGGSILKAWAGGAMTLVLDRKSLRQIGLLEAGQEASQAGAAEPRDVHFIQLHCGTLANPVLNRALIRQAESLGENLRSSRVAEIIGLPNGLQRVPPGPATAGLRRSFGALAIFCDLDAPQFMSFDEPFDWAGFGLSDSDIEDEEQAMEAIAGFVKLAARKGLKTYARDLPSANLVSAAISLGVRYIFEAAPAADNAGGPPLYDINRLVRPAD